MYDELPWEGESDVCTADICSIRDIDFLNEPISFQEITQAAQQCLRNVMWKGSTQHFNKNFYRNCYQLYDDICNYRDITKPFITFTLNERGKERHIQALQFKERVLHKAFNNRLKRIWFPSFILDNYASQQNKGVAFAVKRLKLFLHKYYNTYHTNEGYILLIDIRDYFGSIDHEILYKEIDKLKNKQLRFYLKQIISSYDRGIGLGSELCQSMALKYLDKVDHYIKDKEGIKFYGRYMDDSFIIHKDKNFLKQILAAIEKLYSDLKLNLNTKKTRIIPLKHFKFLQLRWTLTESGKVLLKPNRKRIVRLKCKIKSLIKLYRDNQIDYKYAYQHINAMIKSAEYQTNYKFRDYKWIDELWE